MPKKKDGTKITWKEFFSLWKEGISNITPKQKLLNDVRSNFTMFIGYVVGLIALIIKFNLIANKLLTIALIIIFFGAAWSNGIKWWALKMQLKVFSQFDSNAVDLNKLMDSLEEVKEDKDVLMITDGEVKKGMGEKPKNKERDIEREKIIKNKLNCELMRIKDYG
jgi:hypothetical protein